MCWGYVLGRASASLLGLKINPYLIILLAALPDVDILLGVVGIEHRTWTHSIFLWSIVFVPVFIKYRKQAIPYFVAPIQHILFGDIIVGAWNRPLWPLNYNFALDHGLLSIENIILEALGLAIFLILMFATKYGRMDFFRNAVNKSFAILLIAPLVAFVVFVNSFDWIANVLIDNGLLRSSQLLEYTPMIIKNELFPYAVAMHIVLIIALLLPLLSGFVTRIKGKAVDNKY